MNNNKIRILVLTYDAWVSSNVTGSTMDSIFKGIDNIEIANIFLRSGNPDTNLASKFYGINERQIINKILHKSNAGNEVSLLNNKQVPITNGCETSKLKKFIYSHKLIIFYWAQELIWKSGLWKEAQLDHFIKEFNPDILWVPIFYNQFCNDIALYINQKFNVPMLSFISDDNYTLKQFNLSPFYWLNRFMIRPKIKKVIKRSKQLYVITDIEKQDMDMIFNIDSKILTKGDNFDDLPVFKETFNYPLNLTFLGGLGNGRINSLIDIAKTIEKINSNYESPRLTLNVYSNAIISDKSKEQLNIKGSSIFHGAASSLQIKSIFESADALIHVEPTDLKNRLKYRHSFSTKLVDCMKACRCIIAYGGMTGSIDYINRYNCGIVATNSDELVTSLKKIAGKPSILNEYAMKAYEIGRLNHSKDKINQMLSDDFIKFPKNS